MKQRKAELEMFLQPVLSLLVQSLPTSHTRTNGHSISVPVKVSTPVQNSFKKMLSSLF